ncbi:hypothetical protein HBI56_177910 [Parastagonospora nodorum]|uniref:Uncharacterized protein n=1 Tax=Phaeosphaeria nodorum (strain SN15 / ATCC MYA-4574 / FGSC 10173) TaxID=321614 RepID=A0A7U2HXQ4_PHANO|nr:hypothetical protein HBH56_047400 [Parastagonospora nodorum]QRC92536.1 hypothetical protein JI435_305940 [Parastagonospora nodorum SN15]KAH3933385.1 hypothetical protein HBH54_075140 [Parastagonospora nodorum]KAH3938852.1 hypothetical protein HBH53_244450 [Parastagonospora nodorum]KAH4004177.1 hypothetical protein HBI10_054130 [Parastagonospora nodorum]
MPENRLKYLTANNNLPKYCRNEIIRHTDLQIEETEDKSKASWFLKAIATLQITSSLMQLAGRVASHLTVTPIELIALGYVVSALGVYYFWWHKHLISTFPLRYDLGEQSDLHLRNQPDTAIAPRHPLCHSELEPSSSKRILACCQTSTTFDGPGSEDGAPFKASLTGLEKLFCGSHATKPSFFP